MNDLEKAIDLAVDAYADQTDKGNATYIRHPLRVMEAVDTEPERIVAVLHDVVEDADYSLENIEKEFGEEISDAVDALTRRDDESYMDFIDRSAANQIAKKVKIADIEDNMNLTRLDSVSESILQKQATYHDAWKKLKEDEQSDNP